MMRKILLIIPPRNNLVAVSVHISLLNVSLRELDGRTMTMLCIINIITLSWPAEVMNYGFRVAVAHALTIPSFLEYPRVYCIY